MSKAKVHPLHLLVLLIGILSARAAEPDQFTLRFAPPPADASDRVNARLNQMLQLAVDRANLYERRRRFPASRAKMEKRLYKEMRKDFHNHTKSEFMRELIDNDVEDDGIERQRIRRSDSIYAGWRRLDGMLLGVRGADESRLSFSPVIRMGDVMIGVDKLEHLFERGWHCYEGKYHEGKSDDRVLYLTSLTEKLILGGNRFVTGVYAYADIVANFNGMRFWNDVLQQHDDILGKPHNAGPYVIWSGGMWKVNPEKPIDMTHYVDCGMDEAINCSRYATRGGVRTVREAIATLDENDPHHNYRAPMDPEKLEQLQVKYGNYSKWLLNTRGIVRRGLFFGRR